ncbi:hypothetical protein ACVQTW_001081 [Klebsiella aerogenes]
MSIYSNQHAGGATICVVPFTQAFALSGVFAAGALLLSVSSMIGAIGTLTSLLTLVGAFAVGYAIARWQPWPARYSVRISCYAFVLSAMGWLMLLVLWNSGHGWLSQIPGIAFGGLGLGIVWQNNATARYSSGMMANIPMIAGIVIIILATLLTNHYADSEKGGFVYALAVLVDLALLGAVLVKIRQQEMS